MQASMTACFPLLAGIIREHRVQTGDRRGLGALITALVVGLGLGTLASGVVAHLFDRPTSALWVPAGAMALALAAVWRFVPESSRPAAPAPRGSDWLLAATLSIGLSVVMLAIGKSGSRGWGWSTPRALGMLTAGVLLTGVWLVIAGRSGRSVIDPRMFRDRQAAVYSLTSLAFAFCMIGPVIPDAVYLSAPPRSLGYGLGLAPFAESLALIPNLAAMGIGSVLARRYARIRGDRAALTTGSVLMAAGYLGALAGSRSRIELLGALAVVGLGCGTLQFTTRTLAVEAAPESAVSARAGVNEILITLGGAVGAATAVAIQAFYTPVGHLLPKSEAFTAVWAVCAAIGVASAAVSLCYPTTVRPQHSGSVLAESAMQPQL